MDVTFAKAALPETGALAVGVFNGRKLTEAAKALDRQSRGALSRALEASRFEGKVGEALSLLAPARLENSRVILVGLGKRKALDAPAAKRAGGALAAELATGSETEATVAVSAADLKGLGEAELAANLALGARLRAYRFERYRTRDKAERPPKLARLAILVDDPVAARNAYKPLAATGDSVAVVRDLVSEPANALYPAAFAAEARKLRTLGVEVEALGTAKLRSLGLNAMLGVAQGSAHEPQLVVLRWQGARKTQAPVAFVGKGVTFDTGGISIKPAGGMEEMKTDMAGAGAVLGVIRTLAARRARVNAVGVCAMVENMPSGTAQRPGDVVKSASGQMIEVIDTDAEGRLVLSDALWYTQDRFKPRAMIDLATLTGSIMVALGHEYAGLYANDDELAAALLAAGAGSGEPLWRMPLSEGYDDLIKSDIADMKNDGGRWGDSINAAVMLKRFVGKTPWAHLDIAGTAWTDDDRPTAPKGATGFGVQLLDRYVAEACEER
jgi:leucyl aminopeptidase